MSMMDYLNKKTKKLAAFRKLDELKSKAENRITDEATEIADFKNFFKKQYPGIEPELREVMCGQYNYYKATLENEQIKANNPSLASKFQQIDSAFDVFRAVKTGSVEKYQMPDRYNKFMAFSQIKNIERSMEQDKNYAILSQYIENSKIINNHAGEIAVREAVSPVLYDLLMTAVHKRAGIRLQHPYVNDAINEYNQQYEYCYQMYEDDTKAGKYKPLATTSLDKFNNNAYSQLLDEVFEPMRAKAKAEHDLANVKKLANTQDPTTM